jgi:hypothetical protein
MAFVNFPKMPYPEEEKSVLERKYVDAIKTELPSEIPITTNTIEFIKNHPTMYRGSVRIFTGAIYTDKEFRKLRKYSQKKLP